MYLLFDIGGTKTRLAVTSDLENLQDPVIFPTEKAFDAGIQKMIYEAGKLIGSETVSGISGDIAGSLNAEKSGVVISPNLPGWQGKPLCKMLHEAFGAWVHLENDADLVGLGEAHFGAGQGSGIMAYLTVSTGVGGGRIVHGKIDQYSVGFEPGFQIIDASEKLVSDAKSYFLEDLISGTAFADRFGKPAYEVEDEKAWDEAAQILAYALNNITVMWSPDTIVLGGKMIAGDPSISVDQVREYLEEIVTIFDKVPQILPASLGDEGGLYGAMALLKKKAENHAD